MAAERVVGEEGERDGSEGREDSTTGDRPSSPHGPVVRWPFVIFGGKRSSAAAAAAEWCFVPSRNSVIICDRVRRRVPFPAALCFAVRCGACGRLLCFFSFRGRGTLLGG